MVVVIVVVMVAVVGVVIFVVIVVVLAAGSTMSVIDMNTLRMPVVTTAVPEHPFLIAK